MLENKDGYVIVSMRCEQMQKRDYFSLHSSRLTLHQLKVSRCIDLPCCTRMLLFHYMIVLHVNCQDVQCLMVMLRPVRYLHYFNVKRVADVWLSEGSVTYR